MSGKGLPTVALAPSLGVLPGLFAPDLAHARLAGELARAWTADAGAAAGADGRSWRLDLGGAGELARETARETARAAAGRGTEPGVGAEPGPVLVVGGVWDASAASILERAMSAEGLTCEVALDPEPEAVAKWLASCNKSPETRGAAPELRGWAGTLVAVPPAASSDAPLDARIPVAELRVDGFTARDTRRLPGLPRGFSRLRTCNVDTDPAPLQSGELVSLKLQRDAEHVERSVQQVRAWAECVGAHNLRLELPAAPLPAPGRAGGAPWAARSGLGDPALRALATAVVAGALPASLPAFLAALTHLDDGVDPLAEAYAGNGLVDRNAELLANIVPANAAP